MNWFGSDAISRAGELARSIALLPGLAALVQASRRLAALLRGH
jgi:hypothetical protein